MTPPPPPVKTCDVWLLYLSSLKLYTVFLMKGGKIVKFLCNFRPHRICTSISQSHPTYILYIPLPCSRTYVASLLLKDLLAFPRPHQIRVTLRQLFHGEHEWLTSWSDVPLLFLTFFLLDYKGPDLEEGWRMNYIMGVAVAACICTVFLIVMCTVKLYARNNPSYRNLQSATK